MANDHGSLSTVSSYRIWLAALKEASLAFALAAILLTTFYTFAFRLIYPEFVPSMDRQATPIIAPGRDFVPISVGRSRVEGNSAEVIRFRNDEAILALSRTFEAEDYPFIKFDIEGLTSDTVAKVLWRKSDDPAEIHALTLQRDKSSVSQVNMTTAGPAYSGEISDIALLFFDGPAITVRNNRGSSIFIHSIELKPFSWLNVIEQVYAEWFNPPLFENYSPNVVIGTHKDAVLKPNLVIFIVAATGVSLILANHLISRAINSKFSGRSVRAPLVCLLFLAWSFQESLRWHWRIEQLDDSHRRYSGLTYQERVTNQPQRCSRFPDDCAIQTGVIY